MRRHSRSVAHGRINEILNVVIYCLTETKWTRDNQEEGPVELDTSPAL